MRMIVLGAGLVGGPLAVDLARDFEVTVVDRSEDALANIQRKSPEIGLVRADLADTEKFASLVRDYDLVVNAVPGFMGFAAAKAIIQAGKDCVCISFYEEDPFELDQAARDKNVSMIVDCGVSPGLVNVLIMNASRQFDVVESVLIYVGGLPEIREWPSEYKAVFSPIDVIEEYTRPARIVENGREAVRPALSDREYVFFPDVGTLEAFNTDGLRTLTKTLNAANMREKTLRYPGHVEKMAVLRELGFFSKAPVIDVDGARTSPLDVTSQILFPNWKLKPGERDLTVFRIIIEGASEAGRSRHTIELLDRYNVDTDVISMARTTGYTAAVTARMVAEGLYSHKGVSPPEYLGRRPECVAYLRVGLEERGVRYTKRVEYLPAAPSGDA